MFFVSSSPLERYGLEISIRTPHSSFKKKPWHADVACHDMSGQASAKQEHRRRERTNKRQRPTNITANSRFPYLAEQVAVHALVSSFDAFRHSREDPLFDRTTHGRKVWRTQRTVRLWNVIIADGHENELGGVPHLIAEVTVRNDTVDLVVWVSGINMWGESGLKELPLYKSTGKLCNMMVSDGRRPGCRARQEPHVRPG